MRRAIGERAIVDIRIERGDAVVTGGGRPRVRVGLRPRRRAENSRRHRRGTDHCQDSSAESVHREHLTLHASSIGRSYHPTPRRGASLVMTVGAAVLRIVAAAAR